jgi:hypothetical protein
LGTSRFSRGRECHASYWHHLFYCSIEIQNGVWAWLHCWKSREHAPYPPTVSRVKEVPQWDDRSW